MLPATLDRAVLTVLIPGLVAVAPGLLVLVLWTDANLGFEKYTTIAHTMLFALIAVVGSVFQSVGSFLEVRWDQEREASHCVDLNWFAYLSRILPVEPVGYRYLGRLVTSLQFELAMMFASPIFMVGTAALIALRFREHSTCVWIASPIFIVGAPAFFWWQARTTHEVLCRTRRTINERLDASKSPPEPDLPTPPLSNP